MTKVMTAQRPLSSSTKAAAVLIGTAAALVEDESGGRVFLHGELALAWDVEDQVCRRLAAVQLVRIKAAKAVQVAAGFGVDPDTLRRWGKALAGSGPAALVPARSGPKGPSRLTAAVIADIRGRRAAGASLRAIAAAVGVSTDSVRRALPGRRKQGVATGTDVAAQAGQDDVAGGGHAGDADGENPGNAGGDEAAVVDLPVLPPPGCCLVRQRCSGVCATGSTAWTRSWSKGCCGPWPGSPAPKVRQGSTRSPWAGSWDWTGPPRSRPSAARSPPLLLPGGPTSCSPAWPPPT